MGKTMIDEAVIERVARVIFLAVARANNIRVSNDDWEHLADNVKYIYRTQARAAIEEYERAMSEVAR